MITFLIALFTNVLLIDLVGKVELNFIYDQTVFLPFQVLPIPDPTSQSKLNCEVILKSRPVCFAK